MQAAMPPLPDCWCCPCVHAESLCIEVAQQVLAQHGKVLTKGKTHCTRTKFRVECDDMWVLKLVLRVRHAPTEGSNRCCSSRVPPVNVHQRAPKRHTCLILALQTFDC